MDRIARFLLGFALISALSSPLMACFQQDCSKPIPAPPQLQRLPLPAQVLDPDALAWGIHWGINDRSSIAGQNEGSTYFRFSLADSGIEMDYGVGAPMVIPFMDIRAQLLGYGWQHGPYLTLEAGGDLMPTRHIGLALGAKLGPLSPFVAASIGHSLDRDFMEGNAGLALDMRDQLSLNLGVSRRLDMESNGDILADTATVALDWHFVAGRRREDAGRGELRRSRRRRRDEDQGAATLLDNADHGRAAPAAGTGAGDQPVAGSAQAPADDPCAFSATIDAFDPDRWEARARCLDALGKPDEARAARAKAKALRQEDQDAVPGGD